MSISERVVSAFADRASVQVSEINDETTIKDLGIDSMSFMDLVMGLEQDERLVFSDDEYSKIIEAITVGQVVAVFASAKVA
jgi:acyl carrier protein